MILGFFAEGSDAVVDRLDRVKTDEFDAKMLGRVGRGFTSRKTSFFFKRFSTSSLS